MSRRRSSLHQLIRVFLLLVGFSTPLWSAFPPLRFESSEGLEDLAKILATEISQNPGPLGRRFAEAGPEVNQKPVRVIVASEQSPWASRAAPWISGYALSARDTVVLIPSRISYPQSSLNQTFIHELAHIFSYRASGGSSPPRWFSEGFALLSARQLSILDRGRSLIIAGSQPPESAYQLEFEFYGTKERVHAAYALSGALVRFLTQEYGEDLPYRIFRRLKDGERFRVAFRTETGVTLHEAEKPFWRRYQRAFWWLLGITSTSTLWIAITVLFLLATWTKNRRLQEIRERWAEEERLRETETDIQVEPLEPWVN